MGLLKTIDSFLPDEQIMGLLGRLTGHGQPQAGYSSASPGFDPAPAAPPPQAPRQGPGFGRYAEGFIGGQLPGQVRQQFDNEQARQTVMKVFSQKMQGPTPPSVRDMAPVLMAMQRVGINPAPYLNILDKGAPNLQNVNGQMVDTHDPSKIGQRVGVNLQNVNGRMVDTQNPDNANLFVPDVEKGQQVLYDAKGNPTHVVNIDGAVQAIGERASAQSRGAAIGSAPYDFQAVPTPNGAPGLAAKSAIAGQSFVGQSPAEASMAAAGAQAQVDLPRSVAQADQTLSVIQQLKASPSLKKRTGLFGVAPAIPGTEGANFDALSDQLKGKLFLEAYGSLKGGGQITEVEGKKATDAMARLNRTQTPEAYTKALDDLAEVITAGKDRAQAQAQRGPGGRPSSNGSLPSLADIDAAIARKQGRR